MGQAEFLQSLQLEVSLHGEELSQGISDGCARQPDDFAAVVLCPTELHEHIECALAVGVGQSRDASHAGAEIQILVGVEFIHDQHIHTQLLPGDDLLIILAHIGEGVEFHLKALDTFFDLLDRARGRFVRFEFREVIEQRIDLTLIEIRLRLSGNGQEFEGREGNDDDVPIVGGDAREKFSALRLAQIRGRWRKNVGARVGCQHAHVPLRGDVVGNDDHGFASQPQPF